MEVYDAVSQNLVTNVTSKFPVFTVNGLESGLGFDISLYAGNSKGKSDPTALHAYTLKAAEKRTATPAILHITPILGVLIGVVAALVLIAVVIVVVMRLRGRSGEDEKERDDRGGGRRSGPGGDKTGIVQLSKDPDESIDSMDEKNPDIIPQNSDTDYQDPDEKAFEKLNNAPSRIYSNLPPRIQSPNNDMYEDVNNRINIPKTGDEVTYAELSLPKQPPPQGMYSSAASQMGTLPHIRRQEPTVYAQIDVSKKPAAESCLPLLHHHHHLAAYQHNSSMETPLIQHHRDSSVAIHPTSEPSRANLQPAARVTTTRF